MCLAVLVVVALFWQEERLRSRPLMNGALMAAAWSLILAADLAVKRFALQDGMIVGMLVIIGWSAIATRREYHR